MNISKNIKYLIQSENDGKLLSILILLILVVGFINQFIQDDAFISFRYAENFINGHGLTWNEGDSEPVEGYTNFLWTLLISLGIAVNFDPVLWSKVLGFIFGVGTFLFTYAITLRITKSRLTALLSVLLLGTNYTFSSYLTGGLETQLQTFLIIATAYLALNLNSIAEKQSYGQFLLLSLLFSLTLLTRLDTILICGILFLFVTYRIYLSEEDSNIKLGNFISLIAPGLIIVGTWFIFKYLYYGDILPNTYYVKATGQFSLHRGVYYLVSFLFNYGLIFFVLLGSFYFKKIYTRFEYTLIFVSIIFIWILYILKISGGFMEYRFFVPILPFVFILISENISLLSNWKIKATSALFLIIFSYHHAISFNGYYGIESIDGLNARVVAKNQDWATIGRKLGEIFSDAERKVTISTTAAGAIPYYSKLRTIDMFGLNDKWIARNGLTIDSRPGHSRFTTIQYLIDSEVNLVLGHPVVKSITSPSTTDLNVFFEGEQPDLSQVPVESKIIEIPINADYRVDILYILCHDAIEKAITQYGFETHKINKLGQ